MPVKRAPVAFYDPAEGGGSILDKASGNLGEPLNVIISGLSSPEVLTLEGLTNYGRAIGFAPECLGLHLGGYQSADLGDGKGTVDQATILRQDYSGTGESTCIESLIGGDHFRAWQQNGPKANSGAVFLAVSKEKTAFNHHDIVDNGDNIGRDELVSAAKGVVSWDGVTYNTVVEDITGLMAVGSEGINHGIAVDGIVKLLTVTIQ
ncbi:hypothetical protein OF83DRAFT_1166014 [Amylostereum chailletii]|nr:hypothetical protein OF83DRAFT_1166014 [Amylostereum chailletii]